MAGTQGDPYIVDNLADLRTLALQEGAYIKFTDAGSKYVDLQGSAPGVISIKCAEIDFNGWTFDNYSASTALFNINGVSVTIKNLCIQNLTTTAFTLIKAYDTDVNTKKVVKFEDVYISFKQSSLAWIVDLSEVKNTSVAFISCIFDIVSSGLDTFSLYKHMTWGTVYSTYCARCVAAFCEFNLNINFAKSRSDFPAFLFWEKYFADSGTACDASLYMCSITGNITGDEVNYAFGSPMQACFVDLHYEQSRLPMQNGSLSGIAKGKSDNGNALDFLIELGISDEYLSEKSNGSSWLTVPIMNLFVDNGTELYNKSPYITPKLDVIITACTVTPSQAKDLKYLKSKSWELDEGTNYYSTSFPVISDDGEREPWFNNNATDWVFRINENVNNGYMFLPFSKYPSGSSSGGDDPEQPMWAVERGHIHVYDIGTKQDEFNSNGLAILNPTECKITEELNGMYELYMVHPIDEPGKWKYLIEMNIIKAEGQLFRIYMKDTSMEADGSMNRVIYARHIFYDLNDKLLHEVRPESKNGYDFIDWIMTHMHQDNEYGDYAFYDFSYASDITDTATSYFNAMSPVSALIGADNCMANRLGGELYRNNFYFSVNKHKENSKTKAFNIRYGADMLKVRETIDYTNICTNLIAYDNYGSWYAISYTGTEHLHHHHVTKQVNFTYDEFNYEQFKKDTEAYFETVYLPKTTYEVEFAALKNDKLYADFLDLQSMNVGDSGIIHNEELGIDNTQKIVKKETDAITGETIAVTLGSFKGSIVRADSFAQTVSTGNDTISNQILALQNTLNQTIAKNMIYWDNVEQYTWDDIEQYTWDMLEGNA